MSGKLTSKQQRFVEEYCSNGFNATQAAISAGYSEKTAQEQSSRLLSKVIIRKAVSEFKQKQTKKCEIDAQWLLKSAKEVFDRCMQHEPVMVNGEPTGQYKFEHSGANKALEIIGKHVDVQAFLEKSKVTHELTDDFDSLMGDASSDE